MKKNIVRFGVFFSFFISVIAVNAQYPITLPDIISDHAVLQKDATVNLWGKGPAGKRMQIVATWNSKDTIGVTVGNDCMWQTQIVTPKVDGAYSISFLCEHQLKKINDILLGDVWLCSGQSNMEFNMKWGLDTSNKNYKIIPNDKIRFFQVDRNFDNNPVSEAKGVWKVCDRTSAMEFSTIGYFFGRKIQEKTGVAIGLIGSYWGGTNIQAWMPPTCFDRLDLRPATMHMDSYEGAPRGYSILYNGMIFPLLNYLIKGCVWYQGETNVDYDWNRYGTLLSSMIASWRFGMNNSFSFYSIPPAAWNGYKGRHAAFLREQVSNIKMRVPDYGTIAILDLIDDTTNLHPHVKREVGDRIADLVLNKSYGLPILVAPPSIVEVTFIKNGVEVRCKSTGLLVNKGKNISGFEVAGADGIFYAAQAELDNGCKIKLTSHFVKAPKYVRYCFQNASVPTLFDDSGLPLASFRSDSFTQ